MTYSHHVEWDVKPYYLYHTTPYVSEVTHLEVFHKDGDNDVDKDELWDEHKHDEVDRGNDGIDATVTWAVWRRVAVVAQRVLTSQRRRPFRHTINKNIAILPLQ